MPFTPKARVAAMPPEINETCGEEHVPSPDVNPIYCFIINVLKNYLDVTVVYHHLR